MKTFHAETVVQKGGKLRLDGVPFSEGDTVHVYVSASAPLGTGTLQGSVLKYNEPFLPVDEEAWESSK